MCSCTITATVFSHVSKPVTEWQASIQKIISPRKIGNLQFQNQRVATDSRQDFRLAPLLCTAGGPGEWRRPLNGFGFVPLCGPKEGGESDGDGSQSSKEQQVWKIALKGKKIN